jgi:hypothetical protein
MWRFANGSNGSNANGRANSDANANSSDAALRDVHGHVCAKRR